MYNVRYMIRPRTLWLILAWWLWLFLAFPLFFVNRSPETFGDFIDYWRLLLREPMLLSILVVPTALLVLVALQPPRR